MSDGPEINRFLTAILEAWKSANIDFLVLRNYEGLPRAISNDVDVLVGPQQLDRAESIARTAAESAGFQMHNRMRSAARSLYFYFPATGTQIHLDLFATLKWRGFDFLSCDEFRAQKRARDIFFVPHPAHEGATNLLTFLVYRGKVREKYRAGIAAAFKAEPDAARALIAKTYGTALAQTLVELAAQEKWADIEKLAAACRRALVLRQLIFHPLRTIGSFGSDLSRFAGRILRPPGLTLVLRGPEGSDRTAIADGVMQSLAGTFSPQRSRHFRPDGEVRAGRIRKPSVLFNGGLDLIELPPEASLHLGKGSLTVVLTAQKEMPPESTPAADESSQVINVRSDQPVEAIVREIQLKTLGFLAKRFTRRDG